MHPFQIVMLVSATTMLLISALLMLIRSIPSRPGIRWWLAASLTQAVFCIITITTFEYDINPVGSIIFYSLYMFMTQALSIGTMVFAEIKISIFRRLVLLLSSVVFCIALVSFEHSFFASLFFGAYTSFYLIHSGYFIFRVENNNNKFSYKVSAVFMILMGIHMMDYPFLSTIDWFLPIGFLTATILLTGIFLSLTTMALLQFKTQTLDSERSAIEASSHDYLTGLYNRSYLDPLFNNYVKEAKQLDRSFILLYFDLDGFKETNDTYGHKVGDLILKTISQGMSEWLGSKGDAIRIGGDELVVLTRLKGVYNHENAEIAAKLLLDIVEKPIFDGQTTHHISASVGGVCFGHPHFSLDNMLNKADKLMYEAKKAGGKRTYFSKPISAKA